MLNISLYMNLTTLELKNHKLFLNESARIIAKLFENDEICEQHVSSRSNNNVLDQLQHNKVNEKNLYIRLDVF